MASHDALLTSVGMTTVFGVCPCSCRAFCHGSAYPNSRARSSGLLKHNVGSAILESFRGIMGAACQMFLLGWHCRARAGRVLCNPVVLCSPVQSSVLFVPTERPPPPLPFTANATHRSLRWTKAPLLWGKTCCKRRTLCQPSFPSVLLCFFPFLKCLSQFVASIHLWTDVPKNFTVKLATKSTVLLTWKFSDSRFPYRCMVSKLMNPVLFIQYQSYCQDLFLNNLSNCTLVHRSSTTGRRLTLMLE